MALIGNRKDVLELDELSDECLKANFGYTDAGIENLREQAEEVREECSEMVSFDEMFMANIECTMQDIRLKEDLEVALARYNDLFISGSPKRLKPVSEAI